MDITFGDISIVDLPTPPVIDDVIISVADTTATVSWTTNEPATSRVAYGFTDSYELGTLTDDVLKTSHSITLLNLEPGGFYHCQVSSVDSEGALATSEALTFRTTGGQDLSRRNIR